MAGPTKLSAPIRAGILGLVVLLLALWYLPQDSAEAATRVFKPVETTSRALIFALRGLDPGKVHKARVKVRSGRKLLSKPIGTQKIRRAARSGGTVRVSRPSVRSRGNDRGKLLVKINKRKDPRGPRKPHSPPAHGAPTSPEPADGGEPVVTPPPAPPADPADNAGDPDPSESTGEPADPVDAEPSPGSGPETPPENEPEQPPLNEPSPDDDDAPEPEPEPETPPAVDSCEYGTFSASSMPGGCWRPYSDQSPFNRKLPAQPKLASNSSAIVDWWSRQSDSNMFKFGGGEADTTNDYDHPIYFSEPTDPTYTISCRRWTASCEVHGMKVQIPAAARPARGTDGHLSVIDQRSGWEYDFWEAESLPSGGGTLFIGHGGRTEIGGDGLGSNATAAHFGGAAGVIRPEELATGQIDHALFFVVDCTNDSSVYPAGDGHGRSCASIGKSNSGAPAMGQHFYLDMSAAEIASLALADWQKAVLRAMADYGLFVGDTGGGSLKTLSGTSYTSFGHSDPWVQLGEQLGVPSWISSRDNKRKYLFDLRDAVNWKSKLRVLDPCVARGTC